MPALLSNPPPPKHTVVMDGEDILVSVMDPRDNTWYVLHIDDTNVSLGNVGPKHNVTDPFEAILHFLGSDVPIVAILPQGDGTFVAEEVEQPRDARSAGQEDT